MPDRIEAAAAPSSLCTVACEDFVLEAAAEGAIEGASKRFSSVAYTGGPMRLAGFFHPVVVEIAGVKVGSQVAPVLRQHDEERPVGHSETIDLSAQKIKVSGVLSGVGSDVDHIKATAVNGYPWQTSIGLEVERNERIEAGQTVKVNGRVHTGPLNVVRASRWRELSFVTIGADSNTSASVAASYSGDSDVKTFSEWLQAKSIDETKLDEATMTALKAAYKAETTPPPTPAKTEEQTKAESGKSADQSINDIITAQKKENARQQAITDLVASAAAVNPEKLDMIQKIGEQAIADKWDVDKAEMKLHVNAMQYASPVIHSSDREQATSEVIECAMARTLGLQDAEKHYRPQVLEASDKKFRRGIGLFQAIGLCAQQFGFRETVNAGNYGQALRTIHRGEIRAANGPSTYSFSGMLGDSANKIVREQFMYVERSWDKLAARRSARNFQQMKAYSLTGDMTYRLIPAGGELKHVSAGEKSYTNQIDSYGGMMTLDRRDMINDDVGALAQIYKRFGRGGALVLNDTFWNTVIVAKAAGHFDTTHAGDGPNGGNGGSNYDDGTDTAFGSDGLVAADLIWGAITDKDGKPMNHTAKYLVVPYALHIPAKRLMVSQFFSAADEEGTSNPWAGAFEVVESKYLTSTKAWYLWADPNETPFIEMAFLNGNEMPTVETVEPSPDYLGLTVRGYHDFGCAVQEWRGAVMLKGEV